MENLLSAKLHRHFWNEERGLTSMFILICISNFLIIPFFTRENILIFLLIRIFWLFLLVAGITTLAKNRTQMYIFSIIPILLIFVIILRFSFDLGFLDYAELIVVIAVFAILIGMVLVKVFEAGLITIHRIVGSILIYMLIGNLCAQVFEFLYIHYPGSLEIPDRYATPEVPYSVFLYFSYTTLTTTGYGEILPVQAITRTVVIIEQLIGVLYPVVLIGRLVSLVSVNKEINSKEKQY